MELSDLHLEGLSFSFTADSPFVRAWLRICSGLVRCHTSPERCFSLGPLKAEEPLRPEPKEWGGNGGRPGSEHRAPIRGYMCCMAEGLSIPAGHRS